MAKKKPVLLPGELWPRMPISGSKVEISIIGGTGEYRSGKTLFGLQIAPGAHPEGHKFAGKPRTRVYDVEKSSSTYQGTGAEIVNVIERVQDAIRDPNTGKTRMPTDVDIYLWLVKDIESIVPGQFDVIMIDPVTDFDSGLTTYIRQNPTKFGLTANQVTSGGGLIWGALKSYWKIFLSTVSARCKTFYFVAHLRDEFLGAIPTGKREPKGKDTLLELSSLYLWFERDSKSESAKPSAIVLKERLADTILDQETGEVTICQLIPPRIPVATPYSIREYISNPPDYSKLKAEEKYVPRGLNDDERLAMQAMIAKNNADAAISNSEVASQQARAAEMHAKIIGATPQTSDRTAEIQSAAAESREISAIDQLTSLSTVGEGGSTEFTTEKKTEESQPANEETSVVVQAGPKLVTKDSLMRLKKFLENITYPDNGKSIEDNIQDLLERAGFPTEGGKVKAMKATQELCDKVIEMARKKLVKQGVDPAELEK